MRVFDKGVEKANIWIKDLMHELGTQDPRRAYRSLRAVLHALRDRLSVDEAADMAAELPLVIRGLYYEGWRPSGTPVRGRRPEDLLARVSGEMDSLDFTEARFTLQAVLRVLERHISGGEISDVKSCLPKPIRELWPESH
jgi:uncharacterized protein (DUF2267 family)